MPAFSYPVLWTNVEVFKYFNEIYFMNFSTYNFLYIIEYGILNESKCFCTRISFISQESKYPLYTFQEKMSKRFCGIISSSISIFVKRDNPKNIK